MFGSFWNTASTLQCAVLPATRLGPAENPQNLVHQAGMTEYSRFVVREINRNAPTAAVRWVRRLTVEHLSSASTLIGASACRPPDPALQDELIGSVHRSVNKFRPLN